MDELVNSNLWWNGPEWLQKPNSTPPYEQEILDDPNEEAFQKDSSLQEWNKEYLLSEDNDQKKVHISRVNPSLDIDITRYSSKQRSIRITATVLRFLGELKSKTLVLIVQAMKSILQKKCGSVKLKEPISRIFSKRYKIKRETICSHS